MFSKGRVGSSLVLSLQNFLTNLEVNLSKSYSSLVPFAVFWPVFVLLTLFSVLAGIDQAFKPIKGF